MKILIFMIRFVALTTANLIVNEGYSNWMVQYGTNLSGIVYQRNFLENSQIIEQHNRNASGFELGFNDYSYLNKDEFVNLLCKTTLPKKLLPDRPKLSTSKSFNNFTLNNLPESYSWQQFIRPVKSQGQCGSCWAFATTSMLEGVNKKKDSKWNSELSAQYLVDCDQKNFGCNGGWPTTALNFLKFQSQNEAPTTANYPYTQKSGKCKTQKIPKVKLNIKEIFEFKFNGNEKLMRLRLVNHGPLVIAMYVNNKSGLFQNYKRGVFYEPDCPKTCKDVNHSMLLVGYGVTNDAAKKPYFLILNSWGKKWGENGYIRIAADGRNTCNTACFGIVSN